MLDSDFVLWSNEYVGNVAHCYETLGGYFMATAPEMKSVSFGVAELDMVRQALRSYRKVLLRASVAELNPQVVELRKQSVTFCDSVLSKV